MELAIALQSVKDLCMLNNLWESSPFSEMERETAGFVREALQNKLRRVAPQRLYFGSEYCQYRLPRPKDLLKAWQTAEDNRLSFTLVTPYLPQSGLSRLVELLETLKHERELEVVVNDWGILHLLRRAYPQFQPVVGRLLNKMIRDPRVAHLYGREGAPVRARQSFRQSAYTVSYFRSFLEKMAVKRVELDNAIQGMDLQFDSGLDVSLHIGYGCVATGRSCLVGTLHKPKEEKFKGDVVCRQQCQHYQAGLINVRERLGPLPMRMVQKGNSVFYQQTKELIDRGINWAFSHQVNRLVFSPRIPV